MSEYAHYIKQVEIDALWSGRHHIVWTLDPKVNVLSGVNGVGKSTILNKLIKTLTHHNPVDVQGVKGVRIVLLPQSATKVRFDVVRSFDRPMLSLDVVQKVGMELTTELDFQLYQLQRKYLDYQVDIGNRIIRVLQQGLPDAAQQAEALSKPKTLFQNMVDDLFQVTGKKLVRTENEICFDQMGERLMPYRLSSGEKQMLVILLTVLVEDQQPYVLFMDEPEVSLHIEWQEQLIQLIQTLNPNAQIILTTHSPAVIMNGWLDRVTEVNDITLDK